MCLTRASLREKLSPPRSENLHFSRGQQRTVEWSRLMLGFVMTIQVFTVPKGEGTEFSSTFEGTNMFHPVTTKSNGSVEHVGYNNLFILQFTLLEKVSSHSSHDRISEHEKWIAGVSSLVGLLALDVIPPERDYGFMELEGRVQMQENRQDPQNQKCLQLLTTAEPRDRRNRKQRKPSQNTPVKSLKRETSILYHSHRSAKTLTLQSIYRIR